VRIRCEMAVSCNWDGGALTLRRSLRSEYAEIAIEVYCEPVISSNFVGSKVVMS